MRESAREMAEVFDRLDELETRAGADEEAIRCVENSLGRRLPSEYRAFLLASDGAVGFVGEERYVNLWRVEYLLEANAGYQVERFWPGVTLIGTNGGGDAFGFVWEDGRAQYICFPFLGSEEDSLEKSQHLWAVLLGDAGQG